MRSRAADLGTVSILAVLVTAVMAASVLRAPTERVFGMAIVGRHHDPFTMMQQFGFPLRMGVYSQPITDITGGLLWRIAGPVAAYNWLVLLSFPLSAAAAFLLARHLSLSPAGATIAAMAYAFSPFHIAQSAYHPHIAQIQWMPLYLLALWRCLDAPSASAAGLLAAATIAVTLSNFYGGLIAAVITPVALTAYWFAAQRAERPPLRNLAVTGLTLAFIAGAGIAYASYTTGGIVLGHALFAFPRTDLFLYSAKWWSYLVPPVAHPLLGAASRRLWTAAGVREGLLEQQVALGWGLIALGLVAVIVWLGSRRKPRHASTLAAVPVLIVIAVTALVCSLSPERTIGTFTFVRPSAFLYDLVPMFRSYARFGMVVQLMAALLAGIGVDHLLRAGSTRARLLCLALVTVAAGEYAVSPATVWRDVLPTKAHRWVVQQPGRVQALDCARLTQESASESWLSGGRVTLLNDAIDDCTEPALADKLAANGFTHVIVRRGTVESQIFDDRAPPEGLEMAARFADGRVFAVTESLPAIYTAGMTGFFAREHDGRRTWRWMAGEASWTIVNTGSSTIVATLNLEMTPFAHARGVDVRLDGRQMETVLVEPPGAVHQVGPFTVTPGRHEILFDPADAATVTSDVIPAGDRRPLSLSIGAWTWTVRSDQP